MYLSSIEASAACEEVEYADGGAHGRRNVRVGQNVVQHLSISGQDPRNFAGVYLKKADRGHNTVQTRTAK